MSEQYIEINTDGFSLPGSEVGAGLYENRAAYAKMLGAMNPADVTVIVLAYNRLQKTKRCVESILEYTKGIDYRLILIDSGSTDGTAGYFKSVDYHNKTVIRLTKNINYAFPYFFLGFKDFGRYVCYVSNDVIVTKDWLKNLLLCIESDPKIGMVVPVMNNVSNLQNVDLEYESPGQMQDKAAEYNVPDSKKWEERLRLVNPMMVLKKEVLLAKGYPVQDAGFYHDFSDDDLSFAIRRAGYKLILAGDTWVCHDHDYIQLEDKDPERFEKSLRIGRSNFYEKYYGIDGWDDTNNFIKYDIDGLPVDTPGDKARLLGVDVRCGTPLLDVKNRLRKDGVMSCELSAFTRDPKYWLDLKTVCDGPVMCAPEEYLPRELPFNKYDYIVCDNPINTYRDPVKVLDDLFLLCRPGGYVLLRLKNSYSYLEFLNMLGHRNMYPTVFSHNLPLEVFMKFAQRLGEDVFVKPDFTEIPDSQMQTLKSLLSRIVPPDKCGEAVTRLIINDFIICMKKS